MLFYCEDEVGTSRATRGNENTIGDDGMDVFVKEEFDSKPVETDVGQELNDLAHSSYSAAINLSHLVSQVKVEYPDEGGDDDRTRGDGAFQSTVPVPLSQPHGRGGRRNQVTDSTRDEHTNEKWSRKSTRKKKSVNRNRCCQDHADGGDTLKDCGSFTSEVGNDKLVKEDDNFTANQVVTFKKTAGQTGMGNQPDEFDPLVERAAAIIGNTSISGIPVGREIGCEIMKHKKKRPPRCVSTIAKKMEILIEVDKKVLTRREIARKYAMPNSTLSTIIQSRDKIEKAFGQGQLVKRLRVTKYMDLEQRLFDCLHTRMRHDIPSTEEMREKAKRIASELNIDGFTCSNGWMWRFQKRFNLVKKPHIKRRERERAAEWLEGVKEGVRGFRPSDVFSVDEVGLLYDLLPNGLGPMDGARLTLLLCCNGDGSEKLRPLVVGSAGPPRCFRGDDAVRADCGVAYVRSARSMVTPKIFRSWLRELQCSMSRCNRRILLLLDSCPAHHIDGLSTPNIEFLFFPKDIRSRVHPLKNGPVDFVKRSYRERLVENLLRQLDCPGVSPENMKQWTLVDSLRNVALSWQCLPPRLVSEAFKKAGFDFYFVDDVSCCSVECGGINSAVLKEFNCIFNGTFKDFVDSDKDLETVSAENADTPMETDAREEEAVAPPRREDVARSLVTLEAFVSSQVVDEDTLEKFYEVAKYIRKTNNRRLVQKKIDDFFHKIK